MFIDFSEFVNKIILELINSSAAIFYKQINYQCFKFQSLSHQGITKFAKLKQLKFQDQKYIIFGFKTQDKLDLLTRKKFFMVHSLRKCTNLNKILPYYPAEMQYTLYMETYNLDRHEVVCMINSLA